MLYVMKKKRKKKEDNSLVYCHGHSFNLNVMCDLTCISTSLAYNYLLLCLNSS